MQNMFMIPDNNWDFINKEKNKELLKIYDAIKNDGFFPHEDNVLRFLKMDFNNIKYVIMGMEPYPSSYTVNNILFPEATGRSFEVSSMINKTWQDKFKQSSLRNILKTIYYNEEGVIIPLDSIRKKIANKEFIIAAPSEWFNSLEKQGVLFLNATLTVKPGVVASQTIYWKSFMQDLIIHINEKSDAKWFLWGNDAKNAVLPYVDEKKCIITCHPRLAQFVDENCFQYAKDIDWKGV